MNEEIQMLSEQQDNASQQLLNNQLDNNLQADQDYGAANDNNQNDENRSQMGESVRYGDLLNQAQIERIHSEQKSFKTKIFAISVSGIALMVLTLLVNHVGMRDDDINNDGNCQIGLNRWYMQYTLAVGLKLLVTCGRYYMFKKHRQEYIPLYLVDLIVMNSLMTLIFVKANIMYFDENNQCTSSSDGLTKSLYIIFCLLTAAGYAQFIWCIFLSCAVPLSGFLIYQLVEHRLNQRQGQTGNMFNEGLIGGLMQVPLPIPEILSQLSRTKFQSAQFSGIQTQCAICWADFKENEEVTPLICDERHLYHTKCIEAWIRKGHNTCPLCRKQIANVNGI